MADSKTKSVKGAVPKPAKTVFSNPTFSPEELEKHKKNLAKGVDRKESKARIIQSRLDKQVAMIVSKQPNSLPQKTQKDRTLQVGSSRARAAQAQPKRSPAPLIRNYRFDLGSSSAEGGKKKKKDRYGGRTPEWWEKLMDTGSDLVEHFAPMLMGMGDYDEDILTKSKEPEANSILASASGGKMGGSLYTKLRDGMSDVPSMHEDGLVTRVAHREYIGDVLSSTSLFTPQQFALNPGMKETFPWLSAVAANYTQYQFLGLVFEFVSEGSEYTNSAGLGYVGMATQYDASAANYVDKRSMLNAQFADAAKPSKSFQQWVECSPDKIVDPRRHVRCAANPSNTSINDYDIGNTTLAVGGNVASGAVIGELWVSYDVLLYVPRSQGFVNTTIDTFICDSAAATSTDASIFGSGWTFGSRQVNTFAPGLGGNAISFPLGTRGRFAISFFFTRTTTTTAGSGSYTATYVNCGVATNTAFQVGPNFIAGQANTTQTIAVDVFADGATITYANSLTFFGAGTGTTKICITQIPAGLSSDEPILDRGGRNREANYNKLMDLIRSDAVSNQKVLAETNLFKVVLNTDSSKVFFSLLSDGATQYFIPFEELNNVLGKPDDFVNKFLMCRMGSAMDDFASFSDVRRASI